ncbi:MAG: aspartate--tRNA ligase [Gemmatimonadetes bacterium]|nr:aspartate--tRNA ligase [Gemmatimonadota bacterium]
MSPGSFATSWRTHRAGALRAADIGTPVVLGGWVHRSRNLGGIVFVDLRDIDGIVQVSFGTDWASAEAIAAAAAVGVESVVVVEGTVVARAEGTRNPEMGTGDVEVRATAIRVVGPATTPAIPVARGRGEKLAAEELRLRHRYLDLRRADLQANLVLRHRLMQATRAFLSERGFLEIETPILTKPTPEGARDYLVPSRVHPGEFYALPQSPQIYKQLFMTCGLDRYFQIARCFRDEDLRADRQPEFTQIDIEASFVSQDDILALAEQLVAALWRTAGHDVTTPFPRMTYRDAMERFGCDRPDLRYGLEIADHTEAFRGTSFGIATAAIAAGGRVRGIVVPGGAAWSRKQVDEIEALAKSAGAAGLLRVRRVDGKLDGPLAKFFEGSDPFIGGAQPIAEGALALFVAGADRVSSPALDRVRQECAQRLGLIPEGEQRFLIVTDFPMFDRDPESGALAAVHHPFTSPQVDDMTAFPDAPDRWRANAYDVVLNGLELGGGSIRTHDPAVQSRMFALLGIGEKAEQERRFGFLLEALRAGAPPHGGIAFGVDRIAMLLAGATSLRDVIAFPKTTAARALFEDAPTQVPPEDLADLHLGLRAN